MPPRLREPLRTTAWQWLDRRPTNAPSRIADVFPESVIGQARCRKLVEIGALEPTGRRGYYRLSDWTIADVLAGGGTNA